MVKLIAIETFSEDFISGFFEFEVCYARFSIEKGKSAITHAKFRKGEFNTYETFAAVMGKFLPTFVFLRNPPNIDAEDIDFDLLWELIEHTLAFQESSRSPTTLNPKRG